MTHTRLLMNLPLQCDILSPSSQAVTRTLAVIPQQCYAPPLPRQSIPIRFPTTPVDNRAYRASESRSGTHRPGLANASVPPCGTSEGIVTDALAVHVGRLHFEGGRAGSIPG